MMKEILDKLLSYSNQHDLNAGISDEKIVDFEKTNGIRLPKSLKELYVRFDGGELFIPGTTVYGIFDSDVNNTLRARNSNAIRSKMALANNYLIIARLNYGDLICVDLNCENRVIQWSHETDEEFCEWDSLEQWLSEMIADYEEYEAGGQS